MHRTEPPDTKADTKAAQPDLPGGPRPQPGPGHEESDVSIRGIVQFGIWLAVAAILIHVAMWALFRVLDKREERQDRPLSPMVAANLARTPPGPRLEPDPLTPRRAMLARERAVLETYGWVNRGAGIVRVPIDRAMRMVAERGLPPSKPVVPAVTPGAAGVGTRNTEQGTP